MKEPIHSSFLCFQRDSGPLHRGQHELIPGDFGWVLDMAGNHHDGLLEVQFLQQSDRERAIETRRC